jgi:hypothetical protein
MDAKVFGILQGFNDVAIANRDSNTRETVEARAQAAYDKAVKAAQEKLDAAKLEAAKLESGPNKWTVAAKAIEDAIDGTTLRKGQLVLPKDAESKIDAALAPLALSLATLATAKLTPSKTRKEGGSRATPLYRAYIKQWQAQRAVKAESDPVKAATMKVDADKLTADWEALKPPKPAK